MYVVVSILLFLALAGILLFHFRKKKIIRKICAMSCECRNEKLGEIIYPFGYWHDPKQDIFSSTLHPWQKKYGYGTLYDRAAPFFNMILDCEPIYFDYEGKTWLIEFWKGQYGINTGAEIGIYHADKILSPSEKKKTIFTAVDDTEFLNMSMVLYHKDNCIAHMTASHWWLTAFSMGHFSKPKDLTLEIILRFPNFEMRNTFSEALFAKGYDSNSLYLHLCEPDISITFQGRSHHSLLKRVHRGYVQFKNKLLCHLFCFVTRPFDCTRDKLLYLYYYLPVCFRRMLRLRRFQRFDKKKEHL